MSSTLRTLAATTAFALALFGLTACTDTDDDCDAAGTSPATVAVAAHLTAGKPGGGKSGKSKSKTSKPKKHKAKVHGSDDCEDDD